MKKLKLLHLAFGLFLLGHVLHIASKPLNHLIGQTLKKEKPLTGKFLSRYAVFYDQTLRTWHTLEARYVSQLRTLLLRKNNHF